MLNMDRQPPLAAGYRPILLARKLMSASLIRELWVHPGSRGTSTNYLVCVGCLRHHRFHHPEP